MHKIIIFLTLLLSFSNSEDNATQRIIQEYNERGFYHQFITKEYEIALGYFKKGCELDSGVLCANAASIYWNGDEKHERNTEKAIEYYSKACDLGNAYGCFTIGIYYQGGWFAKPDNINALYYYKKACDLGSPNACSKLSDFNENYININKDIKVISPLRDAKVIKTFGTYTDPADKIKGFNESIILKIEQGKNNKVYNVLNGKVVFIGESDTLGKMIIVAHANKLQTIYASLTRFAPSVYVGMKLKQGYVIGKVEDSLIFQVTQNGKYVNPMELIEKK